MPASRKAIYTGRTTTDGLTVYDLDPQSAELWAVAGPAGADPTTIDPDALPDGFRWITDAEWTAAAAKDAVSLIRVTVIVDGREITRDAESQWDAVQIIQEHHPEAVAVGPWCLRLSGVSEREYAASDAEGAPIVGRMVRK